MEKKSVYFKSDIPKDELGTGHIHISYTGDIQNLKKKIKDKKSKADLMSHIYIGFIINSEIDISDFIKNAESMMSKYNRFSLTYNKNSEILFGDIKVNLDYSNPSL